MDGCGNTTSMEQTIWLYGPCCGYAEPNKETVVDVWPNPTRDMCTLQFKPAMDGRAVLTLYDAQGRPMRVLFDAQVTMGQDVRVRHDVAGLERGVYPYQLQIDGRITHGRLMVQ